MITDPDAWKERTTEMVRIARLVVRDAHEAEDVVQDAWSASLTNPPDDPKAFDRWFPRVVRLGGFYAARRRRRRREVTAAAPARSSHPSAADQCAADDLAEHVRAAVDTLDEPLRKVVNAWLEFEGAGPDAADALGIPRRTFRDRLERARTKLRHRLDREPGSRAAWMAVLAPLARRPPTTAQAAAASAGGASTLGWLSWVAFAIAVGVLVLGTARLVPWPSLANGASGARPTRVASAASGHPEEGPRGSRAPQGRGPSAAPAAPGSAETRPATAEPSTRVERIAAAFEASRGLPRGSVEPGAVSALNRVDDAVQGRAGDLEAARAGLVSVLARAGRFQVRRLLELSGFWYLWWPEDCVNLYLHIAVSDATPDSWIAPISRHFQEFEGVRHDLVIGGDASRLAAVLRGETSREEIVSVLVSIRASDLDSPEVRAAIDDLAARHPDPDLRRRAIGELLQVGDRRCRDLALDIVTGPECPPEILGAAVRLLSRSGEHDVRVAEVLADLAEDPSAGVVARRFAASGLGAQTPTPRVLRALREATRSQDPNVARNAAQGLERHGMEVVQAGRSEGGLETLR